MWSPCYGYTLNFSNKRCKCKTQMQNTCTKKWQMHAPSSGWAALVVKNANVNILQLNVKGITSSKLNTIEQLVSKHAVGLILLQETHCTNPAKLVLSNYDFAGLISSKKHGLATFVHKYLRWTHEGESPTTWIFTDYI